LKTILAFLFGDRWQAEILDLALYIVTHLPSTGHTIQCTTLSQPLSS